MIKQHGFPRSSRISRAYDFAAVKADGMRVCMDPIVVAAKRGAQRRLGVIVSRRVGNAVTRNSIRRTVREFFRLNNESFPRGDCVIIAGRGSGELTSKELASRLDKALRRLQDK